MPEMGMPFYTKGKEPDRMKLKLPKVLIQAGTMLKEQGYDCWIAGSLPKYFAIGVDPWELFMDHELTTTAPPETVMRLFSNHYQYPDNPNHIAASIDNIVDFHVNCSHPKGMKEDVENRDFTFNSMAIDTVTEELYDPHHGYEDLQNHIIKAAGDPVDVFSTDPLRILRMYRYAAEYNSAIDPETLQAARALTPMLKEVHIDRTGKEMRNILRYGRHLLPEMEEIFRILYSFKQDKGYWEKLQGMRHYRDDTGFVLFLKNTELTQEDMAIVLKEMFPNGFFADTVVDIAAIIDRPIPTTPEDFAPLFAEHRLNIRTMACYYDALEIIHADSPTLSRVRESRLLCYDILPSRRRRRTQHRSQPGSPDRTDMT